MDKEILTGLNQVSALKTIGAQEVLALLSERALQAHQLPAAILLPKSATAQNNPFIGGHVQSVEWQYEVLLVTALPASSRQSLSMNSVQIVDQVITTLSGLSNDDQTLQFSRIEPLDLMNSLDLGQLLQRVIFTSMSYERKAS